MARVATLAIPQSKGKAMKDTTSMVFIRFDLIRDRSSWIIEYALKESCVIMGIIFSLGSRARLKARYG